MTDEHGEYKETNSLFLSARARADFEGALRKGFWRAIWSWVTQSDNRLLPFDEIRKQLPVHGQHDIGMQQIPLDKVIGSVGRYQDFDRAFLPRHSFLRSRWVSIDTAQLQDITLPPVDVYKIGDVYFVKDGNHRVSVARERGQAYIDANVIEIASPVPVTPDTDIDNLIRQVEKIDFYEKTNLALLRPEANIELTLPGGYGRLLEHIHVHRWFMGEQRRAEIPFFEAVTGWYDEVYLPMVEVIQTNQILKNFPGRTEADLYLWINEHLWYLREEYQQEVSAEQAAQDYTRNYSQQPFRWLMDLAHWTARWLGRSIDPARPE
jgi:hypothetical protein